MRRAYQITDKAPPAAEMAQIGKVVWVKVGSNDFTLEDGLRFGWVEEIDPPERFRDEWDIEIKVDNRLVPLDGDPNVLAVASLHVEINILKGFQKVLSVKNVKSADVEANPELLKELLEILNTFPSSEDGPKTD